MVLFDQGTYDKLLSEAPKYKLITPSILSDRLRVSLLLIPFCSLWYRLFIQFLFQIFFLASYPLRFWFLRIIIPAYIQDYTSICWGFRSWSNFQYDIHLQLWLRSRFLNFQFVVSRPQMVCILRSSKYVSVFCNGYINV